MDKNRRDIIIPKGQPSVFTRFYVGVLHERGAIVPAHKKGFCNTISDICWKLYGYASIVSSISGNINATIRVFNPEAPVRQRKFSVIPFPVMVRVIEFMDVKCAHFIVAKFDI
jgi:hypothetical protein